MREDKTESNSPWFELRLSPHSTIPDGYSYCSGEYPVAIINNGCSHKTHGAIQKFGVCWFCEGAIRGELLINHSKTISIRCLITILSGSSLKNDVYSLEPAAFNQLSTLHVFHLDLKGTTSR